MPSIAGLLLHKESCVRTGTVWPHSLGIHPPFTLSPTYTLPAPPPLPHTHSLQVESLLESIPRMFANSQVQETCGGAALRSAVDALKGGEGGRLHAFLALGVEGLEAFTVQPRQIVGDAHQLAQLGHGAGSRGPRQ